MKTPALVTSKIGKATWTFSHPVQWRWTRYTEREARHDWRSGMPGKCDDAGCSDPGMSPGDYHLRIETPSGQLVHRACERCALLHYGLSRGAAHPQHGVAADADRQKEERDELAKK